MRDFEDVHCGLRNVCNSDFDDCRCVGRHRLVRLQNSHNSLSIRYIEFPIDNQARADRVVGGSGVME